MFTNTVLTSAIKNSIATDSQGSAATYFRCGG